MTSPKSSLKKDNQKGNINMYIQAHEFNCEIGMSLVSDFKKQVQKYATTILEDLCEKENIDKAKTRDRTSWQTSFVQHSINSCRRHGHAPLRNHTNKWALARHLQRLVSEFRIRIVSGHRSDRANEQRKRRANELARVLRATLRIESIAKKPQMWYTGK